MRMALGYVHVSTDEQADSDRYGIEPVAVAEGFSTRPIHTAGRCCGWPVCSHIATLSIATPQITVLHSEFPSAFGDLRCLPACCSAHWFSSSPHSSLRLLPRWPSKRHRR